MSKHYFSTKGDQLLYLGEPLARSLFLEESREILRNHVIPSRDSGSLYKALIFCILSQAMIYERAVKFTRELNGASLEQLANGINIHQQVVGRTRWKEDRFSAVFEFIEECGGIEKLAEDFLRSPHQTRETFVKGANWIAHKTASFWYLCIGGKELMTLDVHNFRQLAGIEGINIPEKYFESRRRESGTTKEKMVVVRPGPREYRQIEEQALRRLGNYGEFIFEESRVDGALATTVFWWGGVRARKADPRQLHFREILPVTFENPYQ